MMGHNYLDLTIVKIPTIILVLLLQLLYTIDRGEDEPNPKAADVEKLIEYVENSQFYKSSPNRIRSEFVPTLIKAKMLDKAFKIISEEIYSINFREYCDQMRSGNRYIELAEQLEQLLAKDNFQIFLKPEDIKLYRAEAAVMRAIKNDDIQSATGLYFELSRRDGNFVKVAQDILGEGAAKKFIDSIVARLPEKVKDRRRQELLIYLKPNSRELLKAHSKRLSLAYDRKKFEELKALERRSKVQWLEKATWSFNFSVLSVEAQSAYVTKVFEALDEELLAPEKTAEYRWRLVRPLIKHKKWDLLLRLVQNHEPVPGVAFRYERIFDAIKANCPNRLNEFVEHLPDANNQFSYSKDLLDMLLEAGYLAKAARNVHSVEPANLDQSRLKTKFYQTMYAAEFKDVDKIVAAYDKVIEGAALSKFISDFGKFEQALGYEHLALIAERGGPEIALQVSRAIPQKLGTVAQAMRKRKTGNALGNCLLPLLLRNKSELAFEIGKLATPSERAEARLGQDGRWPHKIELSVWASLKSSYQTIRSSCVEQFSMRPTTATKNEH